MAITAGMVKELREMTGAGMIDCKKALTEADGSMEKAVELLREKGLAASAKKAGDGIRAKLLENAGYETQILEFIDMEHTPKNLLIRAVKRQEGSKKLPEELKVTAESEDGGQAEQVDEACCIGLVVILVLAEGSGLLIVQGVRRGDACVDHVALVELQLDVAGHGLCQAVGEGMVVTVVFGYES